MCYSSLVILRAHPWRSPVTLADRRALLQEIGRLELENAALLEDLRQLQAAIEIYRQVLCRLAERDQTMSALR